MAASTYERIGRTLKVLKDALRPYEKRESVPRYGANWMAWARYGQQGNTFPTELPFHLVQ